KPGWVKADYEPKCFDIDVAGLHMADLRSAKCKGVTLSCKSPVEKIEKVDGAWAITSRGNIIRAAEIINAAGAWAGEMAKLAGALPIDIQPRRRMMVQLSTNPPSPSDLPLVVALDGSFCFNPEEGSSYWS